MAVTVCKTHNFRTENLPLKLLAIVCAEVMFEIGGLTMLYGYARVSTGGQSLTAQDAALRAAGCGKIFAEKVSGAKTDRAELAKLLKRLDKADVVIVSRLDRLARSTSIRSPRGAPGLDR